MVRPILVCSLVLASFSAAFAQPDPAAIERQVADAESAWAAAYQGCKTDVIDKLMTDDFTLTDFNGMTYSRTRFMKAVKDCTHTVVRIEPMLITPYDRGNTVIVLSKLHQFVQGQPVEVNHLTHVLVRQSGAWKVAHHHATVILPSGVAPNPHKSFPRLAPGLSTERSGAAEKPRLQVDDLKMAPDGEGGSSAAPALPRYQVEQQIVDTANTYGDSIQNCKVGITDRITTKGYTITGFHGGTFSRGYIIATSEECAHDLQRIEPMQLRLYGDNTAIMLSRYHQWANRRAIPLFALTQVFIRQNGAWRVAQHHSTRFDEKAGMPDGKLFWVVGGDSQVVPIQLPNKIGPIK